MKRIILALALVASTAISYGQGTIIANNGLASRATLDGSNIPAGTALNFGVFYGASADSLTLATAGLGSTSPTTAGLFTFPAGNFNYALAGTAPLQQVFIQVRAWSSSFGSDWQAAQSAFNAGVVGTRFGQTSVVLSEALGATSGPGAVIWQGPTGTSANRFTPLAVVTAVPEPSTIALGILGAGSLLFLRRKK